MRYKAIWATALITTTTVLSAVSMANSREPAFDAGTPIQFSILPSNPVAGQSLNMTVTMPNTSSQVRHVSVHTGTPGNFDELPSSITVQAGSTVGTATAVIDEDAEGSINVTAGGLTVSASLESRVRGGR